MLLQTILFLFPDNQTSILIEEKKQMSVFCPCGNLLLFK